MNHLSVFEYLYRDASNFKVWGEVVLRGRVADSDVTRLRQCLDAGEFFIAEQIGLPTLYEELWAFSGGPTSADHVWHTFHALRSAQIDEGAAQTFDTTENFIARFEAISKWNRQLSPYWDL